MFTKVRNRAAEIFDAIGAAHPEVQEICTTNAFICREHGYEGPESILKGCLEVADEIDSGFITADPHDLDDALHDPICDVFYDARANMKDWDAYWQSGIAPKDKKVR